MEIQDTKNNLNLVFDNWNENLPVPNGKDFFPEYDFGCGEYISGTYGVNTKHFKLNDVFNNETKKFFYLIHHGSIRLEHILSSGTLIKEDIIELIRNIKNFYLLFLDPHESYLDNDFYVLKNFLDLNSIPQNKVYVINNNHLTNKQINKHGLSINFHSNIFIPTGYVTSIRNSETEFIIEKKNKFFICLNNMKKKHRLVLLSFLKKNNIIKDVNWSYREGYQKFVNDYNEFNNILKLDTYKELKSEIDYFNNLNVKDADFEDDQNNFYIGHISEIKRDQQNSFINIVTESIFLENDVVQITEKSLKPFFYYQIPIFCATHLHVKSLREKYDFDMFDDIVNHSYDNIKDNVERMEQMMLEIKRLNDNKLQIINQYPDLKSRMDSNKMKLLNISKMKDDDLFYKKMINE